MALAFEQQVQESAKAFAAFSLYLSMGSERSLSAVEQKLDKSGALIARWSSRWRWMERVGAHAAHFATVEREASEVMARGKAAEWLRRQQVLREREWMMHEKCIAAAERGLKAYMEREKVYANLADIARMLEVASKLGRLASGLATDKTEVSGEAGGPIRVELSAALNKIYGTAVPSAIVEQEDQSQSLLTSAPTIIGVKGAEGKTGGEFRRDAEMGGRDDRATQGTEGKP